VKALARLPEAKMALRENQPKARRFGSARGLLADRTKMFHVKHFGTIGAKKLMRPHTSGVLEMRKLAQKIGLLGGF
jgi:hypothetical protein